MEVLITRTTVRRAFAVLGCLVLVGCTAFAPTADPPAATTTATTATTAALPWTTCAGAAANSAVRCTTVPVPLVPGERDSPAVDVAVARLPAARPSDRIGVLVVNPGGPGASSVGLVTDANTVQAYFPQELRDRFDLVEVDGRGVGGTAPVHCTRPVYDDAVSRFPTTAAAVTGLTASNARFAGSCASAALPRLDTVTDAADLDAVRVALGEDKISFLGLSYGSMLAQTYAEGYGSHVRAMVVDGVVDRSLTWQQLTDDDAEAVEDSYRRFAAWCTSTASCGRDMVQLVTDVLEDADEGQLGTATAGELAMGVNNALHSTSGYPALATALIAAHDQHDAGGLLRFVPWTDPGYYAAYRTIICQDVPVTGLTAADTARVRAAGPTLRGESEFWEIASGCAGWPGAARWTPHPWQPQAGFPGMLVVAGAHDPVTPAVFARGVAARLPNATLLTWAGDGHTAWANDDTTQGKEVAYLVEDH